MQQKKRHNHDNGTSGPAKPRFLYPKEVASLLGVAPVTVRGWRNRGIGPSYTKVGGVVLYPTAAFESYLAAHTVTPEEASRG